MDENPLWSNPCDYKNVDDIPVVEYKPKNAGSIAVMARNERNKAAAYSNDFSQTIHSYPTLEELLSIWDSSEWLRNYSWFEDKVLPEMKKYNQPLPADYISSLMGQIDTVLPLQYKALKMIVAALDAMAREGFNDQPTSHLKPKITQTMHGVRGVLCGFKELLQSRNLPIMKIDSSEIPRFDGDNNSAVTMLLVYRDTLNMLHYLEQIFEAMSNV